GCETLLHLDNAGAALQPRCVREAVAAHLELEQDLGGYAAEGAVAPNLAGLYDSLAGLIGAQPSEIAVMENATRAWDAVFYA
ncbi:aminotransferase, partial [Acinetobacter baumannii]